MINNNCDFIGDEDCDANWEQEFREMRGRDPDLRSPSEVAADRARELRQISKSFSEPRHELAEPDSHETPKASETDDLRSQEQGDVAGMPIRQTSFATTPEAGGVLCISRRRSYSILGITIWTNSDYFVQQYGITNQINQKG